MVKRPFSLLSQSGILVLRLNSEDGTNRLTRDCVGELTDTLRQISVNPKPLVISGTSQFFSAGADLQEIAQLNAPDAYEFSKLGQQLMQEVENLPMPVIAAISGYCMGGGLDLALACHSRVAARNAIFGHRGTALGLLTGWGGTQRLPRLIGKAKALCLFVGAEKIDAQTALEIGLVEAVVPDPVSAAVVRARAWLDKCN